MAPVSFSDAVEEFPSQEASSDCKHRLAQARAEVIALAKSERFSGREIAQATTEYS